MLHDDAEDLLTPSQAAAAATIWRRLISAGAAAVTPQAICNWASRGHLEPAGLDDRGSRLYRRSDVAQAERRTRGRALRLVGIPQRRPT